jgi:hypothetical protein
MLCLETAEIVAQSAAAARDDAMLPHMLRHARSDLMHWISNSSESRPARMAFSLRRPASGRILPCETC